MWRLIPIALLAALACKTTPRQVPEGQIAFKADPDYAKFRPVQIAVLPVKAPTSALRIEVRREIYDLLIKKQYSPFTLQAVDRRLGKKGVFTGEGLDWDATLMVTISRFKPVRGTRFFVGDGRAELRHKTGAVIWTCSFENYSFRIEQHAGEIDERQSSDLVAHLFIDRLPERPPLTSE